MAEFEIANNTEKELAISSALSFDAYADDYALNFSFSALMEKEGNQLDGTIAAGKKLKGWIGWEVPADYQNVEIHFTDNVWSSDKFVFVTLIQHIVHFIIKSQFKTVVFGLIRFWPW